MHNGNSRVSIIVTDGLGPIWISERRLIEITCDVSEPQDWNDHISLKFDRLLGSTATDTPVQFQGDWTILNINLAGFTTREIVL